MNPFWRAYLFKGVGSTTNYVCIGCGPPGKWRLLGNPGGYDMYRIQAFSAAFWLVLLANQQKIVLKEPTKTWCSSETNRPSIAGYVFLLDQRWNLPKNVIRSSGSKKTSSFYIHAFQVFEPKWCFRYWIFCSVIWLLYPIEHWSLLFISHSFKLVLAVSPTNPKPRPGMTPLTGV